MPRAGYRSSSISISDIKSALIGVAGGFLIAAAAAELLLHFLPVSTGYSLLPVDEAHPILLGKPYAQYVYSKDWNFRLHNSGRLNNYGLRASADYRPDPRAILVIGNSYIQADAIPPPQTFTEQLARRVGRPAYAIGVDGFSLADYLVAARWASVQFWPQQTAAYHTLVVLLTTGDLDHTCQPRSGEHYLSWARATGPIELQLVPRRASHARDALNQSRLFRYLFANLLVVPNWSKEARDDHADTNQPEPRPSSCASSGYEAAATSYLLNGFGSLSRSEGARIVFVVSPGYRREQGYMPGDVRDVDRFALRARERGFTVLKLDQAFSAALDRGLRLDFVPIDAHWNLTANTIAARVVGKALGGAPAVGPSTVSYRSSGRDLPVGSGVSIE